MTAPVILASPNQDNRRTVLVVTADKGSSVTVWRRFPGGVAMTVRGATNVVMERTEKIFVDYELPQGVTIEYWCTSQTGTDTPEESNHQTIPAYDFGGDVLFDLANPKRGMKIIIESFDQNKYGISRDVVKVWGRPDPVVVSGVREMPSGTLNLVTLTLEKRRAFLDIIENGSTVALSPWKANYGLEGVVYLAVGDVTENRVTSLAVEPTRRWALDVQQVSQPASAYTYPSDAKTWGQFKEKTWGQVKNNQWWEAVGL